MTPTATATFRGLLGPEAITSLRPRTWRAAPPVDQRDAWAAIAPADRETVIESALAFQERLRHQRPTLSLWHHYSATGERTPYERAQRSLLGAVGASAMALAVTAEERWAEVCADATWDLCELSAWCLPSHYALPETGERPPLPQPGRDILDLSDAYVGGMLAAVDTFAGEYLERRYPGLRARVHYEIGRRVLDPWRKESYFWHGLEEPPNNWAPWIVSNVLTCAAVVEPAADVLADDVGRALRILDRFRAAYAPDGSCDEGATYWWWAGATLFEALDLLREASGGALDGFAVEPVAAMSAFPMRMQIGADTQVNYSDGAPTLPPNASWHLLARFGETVGDEEVVRHGRWMGRRHPFHVPEQIAPQFLRTLRELRDPGWSQGPAAPGMPSSWFAAGTEVSVARERAGDTDGWFVAVKGGHNDVSHNHNDVGGVIASLDGAPVLIDVGVGEYRRETFEPATRYGIWTMRSAYHSVPLPDGVEQSFGEEFAARGTWFVDDGLCAVQSMDLAPAYPPEAGLLRSVRTVTLQREAEPREALRSEGFPQDGVVILHDSWEFAAPARMSLVLMTTDAPEVIVPGATGSDAGACAAARTTLRIGAAHAVFDAERFVVSVEAIPVDDPKLASAWGPHVHRILLRQREPLVVGELRLEFVRATPRAWTRGAR